MAPAQQPRQHGVKGVYVGGEWVDIEDCGKKFSIEGGSHCSSNGQDLSKCAACPRSRSHNSAAKADGTYDVVIIGAGCIGTSIARELSKTTASVLVLEAADDVTQGATKGNSGIVHAGFDDTPGTNRAKFCWPGNQMFPDLDKELHFGYQKNGSLVLAITPEEVAHLNELKARGEKNGVKRLKILNREEVLKLEPRVNPNVQAALLAPDAGNLIPYEYTIAMAENAVDNGVELRIRRIVKAITSVKNDTDGGGVKGGNDNGLFELTVDRWETDAYLNACGEKSPSASSFLNSYAGVISWTISVVLGGIAAACFVNLAADMLWVENKGKHDANDLFRARIGVGMGVAGLVNTVLMLIFNSWIPSGAVNYDPSKPAPKSVGSGGRQINIEEMKIGGSGSYSAVGGRVVETETIRARYIVNAAGSGSDKIANMIGDHSFKIKPRVGDYLLLNRNQGHLTSHTLFPCPGPLGKGVLVQTTLWGNLILGPTARDMHLPEVAAEKPSDIQTFILSKCKQLVHNFDPKETIHAFSGARAKSDRGDWIIEASSVHPRFIHAAGIDSPGLAGSPAIALEIVRLLKVAGLNAPKNPNFNPNRAPIIRPKNGWKDAEGRLLKPGPVGKYKDLDPRENVVCKCELVTEAEVITAIHRSLPVDSTQAIRKRTRAGMGHCQGQESNYDCECRVANILARELDIPVEAVGRRPWPATSTLSERWIGDAEREKLEKLKAI